MPSPFPGIDPYLESQGHWHDFHARLVPTLSDVINDQLPESYVAQIDERVAPIELSKEVESEIYLEILHLPDEKVVTIVELLSPSNKAGAGRRDYLARRHGLMIPDVHLVELDFLIGGHRLRMERPMPPGDYYAVIARAERRPDCDVFAWTLRDPLPVIPIPLLPPDPDVLVDLAPPFASVHERGRYARLIRYHAPLDLPLTEEDRVWAEEQARTATAR
jgi:hypothetical protein